MKKKLKEKKNIIYYCNANSNIGFGHLSRIIALASFLNKMNYTNILIGPDKKLLSKHNRALFSHIYTGKNSDTIKDDVNSLIYLSKKFNSKLLILDDYRVKLSDQKLILKNNLNWLQFDLYGKNILYADIILNYSPNSLSINYNKLIKDKKSILYLGPKFALLKNEFHRIKKFKVKKIIKKIFICFGGGNDRGGIIKMLDAIMIKNNNIKIEIVSGNNNPSKIKVQKLISKNKNINIHFDTSNIKKILSNADIALISGGTISYECAAIGVPMLITSIEKNQINTSKFWNKNKSGIYLGHINEIKIKKITSEIERLSNDFDLRKKFSLKASKICDGKGSKKIALNIDHFIKSNKRL